MSLKRMAESAVEALPPAPPAPGTPSPAAPGPPPAGAAAAINNALSALLQYIPAEATAIYLATTSAIPAIQANIPSFDPLYVYWVFVFGIVPLLFALLYYNQIAQTGKAFPGFAGFPWFRLFASVVAFAVWALCVPGNPYSPKDKPGYGVLWGIVAVLVSVILPLIEAIYNYSTRTE